MADNSTYSEIRTVTLDRFKVARYVMISPNPELDVMAHMDRWAQKSGLLEVEGYTSRKIGWDFPFVTEEQQNKFGLRGYVAAYVIPDDFVPACGAGAEIAFIEKDTYAKLTVTDPFGTDPFLTIPKAYQLLMDYAKPSSWENRTVFEEICEIDGIQYMHIYVPMNGSLLT